MLSISEFAARLADPIGLGEDAGAAGGVAAVVDLDGAADQAPSELQRRALRTLPGVIVGVLQGEVAPAAASWSALTDVVLSGAAGDGSDPGSTGAALSVAAGEDLDRHLEGLLTAIAQRPRAAAGLALLLRGDRSIDDGLVAESAVYSMLQGGPEFAAWRAERAAGARRPAPKDSARPVTVSRDGHCLTIRLSRPARHNALNTAMRDALVEAFALALADTTLSVRLVGDGPSFCSGGDLDDFGTTPDPATAHLIRLTRSPAALAGKLGPRLEARVHGACMGAGVELAAFAARVVAHPDSFFALPEVALGLIPGSGGTVSLPRRIGRHRTAWMAFTGERITADRARAWGLVDDVIDDAARYARPVRDC